MIQLLNISKFSRATRVLFLVALFSSSLFSNTFTENLKNTTLYDDPYWQKLLHYRNGESEVDSENFFVSKEGKTDFKKEFFETIDALTHGKKNVLCRFPLRVEWLKENLPHLGKNIKTYECKDLDEYMEHIGTSYVTLIFPTGHLNSPASMYGHTFLRLSQSKDTPLLANAVNYAAKTNEKNGLLFAFNGIFGGYQGRYSILPYYKKIKEYNNLEQRDVWEYDLNFTKKQTRTIALHAYELKDSYSYYHFFLENCSYNLLWFFEIARPDMDLISQFHLEATPIDTIRSLKPYHIITHSNYRYSKVAKMKFILSRIENRTYLKDFLDDSLPLQDDLSEDDKIRYLDLKVEYLRYQRSKREIDEKKYIKEYMGLLRQRSTFEKISNYVLPEKKDPLNSHKTRKIEFSYLNNDSLELTFKPVYNDIHDIHDGYLQGAYIDFFKFDAIFEKKRQYLDKLIFLNIESYAPIDLIFKPISWGIQTSYKRFKHQKGYFNLAPQVGITFGGEKEFLYSMAISNYYAKAHHNLLSIGGKIGVVTNRFDGFKFGLSYSYEKYNKKFENKMFELFATAKLSKNLSLNLNYTNDDLQEQRDVVKASFFYYF